MPRNVKVSDVKANLLRPATTSHFEVEIPIPTGISSRWNTGKKGKLQLMCSETSLPGSNLATFEINNDRTGVTEKHVHRRIFDDRIDLTFYVDGGLYSPIRFFEDWMALITNNGATDSELQDSSYNYRMRYPKDYMAEQGLIVRKFEKEKTFGNLLEYEFVNAFPLAINSMPVSYDTSSLLKCTVSMSYIRYVVKNLDKIYAYPQSKPKGTTLGQAFTATQQAGFNAAGFLGGLVNAAVDNLTGNDLLGDIAGGFAAAAMGDIPAVQRIPLIPPAISPPRPPSINPPG